VPREATGQVLKNANGYSGRVRVAPGDEGRPSFPLAVRSDAEAEKRVAFMASMAKRLRGDDNNPKARPGDLRTAGVRRRELFERSATRQPIRLHDLRAMFVTVSLANGRSEPWVTDRTGHKSSQMLSLYTRRARTWAKLELGTLGPLDALLAEARRRREGGEEGEGSPPNRPDPMGSEWRPRAESNCRPSV
jgi:hypothetical protein